jgi:stress response protein SCP2
MAIPIDNNTLLTLGLSWDLIDKRNPIDMDISSVFFGSNQKIIDSVYYNKQCSDDGSMSYNNDSRNGADGGNDESVNINLSLVHPAVSAIVCNVSCYSKHTLDQIESGEFEIINSSTNESLLKYNFGDCTDYSSAIMCIMYRTINGWYIESRFTPCQGKNFQEFTSDMHLALAHIIAPPPFNEYFLDMSTDRTFDVSKGDIVNCTNLKKVKFGIGWTSKCDVDSSCVMMTADNRVHQIINYGKLSSRDGAIKHSGDNRTGEGSGDDEIISVKLKKINPEVNSLIFTVTIYTPDYTFSDVSDLYVRVADSKTSKQLIKYNIINYINKYFIIDENNLSNLT